MKKLFFLFSALLLSYFAEAQNISYGFKLGLNYSSFEGKDTEPTAQEREEMEEMGINDMKLTYAPNFHVGAFIKFHLNDQFSIQPEVLYSLKGTGYSFKGPDFESADWEEYFEDPDNFDMPMKKYEGSETLHYLDVPVMAQYKINNFFLEAGPTLSFFLKSEAELDGQEPEEEETGGDNAYRKIDLGYALGAGYQLNNGVLFSARYNGGIISLDKNGNEDARNSVFQLSVGFQISR